jgi:hypothetical protein
MLCGCDTLFLILVEERELQVLETVLREVGLLRTTR